MEVSIDYRNAKYQGQVNESQVRNGYGILVDDELSLYASHWKDGKLNDATMIYISHGKYIYGLWRDNQPHGLNVFRIGDTVVLGEFDNGYLIKKIVIIFEKFNFVAILQQKNGDWIVEERGVLKNYNQLIHYIEQSSIPMKPHYFSLTKYLTSMSNERVFPVPCQGSQNCYYGYQQGLGIVFNASNGVVSVGCHQNKKLTEFGGRYQSNKSVTQGNFLTNQIIKYSHQRPKQQIYSIFQKIHKRSLNFKNQYFDSKVKLLTHIEQLIRGKIQQIVNQKYNNNCENTFTALDLNDSLDYHYEYLQEINKVNQAKQVYQATQTPMKKTISQYTQNSPKVQKKRTLLVTPSKKNTGLITNAPASPLLVKKSPLKTKEKDQIQKQKQIQRIKQRQRLKQRQKQIEKLKKQLKTPTKRNAQKYYNEQSFRNKQQQVMNQQMELQKATRDSPTNLQGPKSPYQLKYRNDNNLSQIEQQYGAEQLLVSSKDYIRQKDSYNVPSFKYSYSQVEKTTQNHHVLVKNKSQYKLGGSEKLERVQRTQRIQKSQRLQKVQRVERIDNVQWIQTSGQSGQRIANSPMNTKKNSGQNSISPSKPCYENLSERRKRLLKQFKNLNTGNEAVGSAISKILPASVIKNISMNTSNNTSQIKTKQSYQYRDQIESPCARQKLPYYESKNNTDHSQTMMPLTICRMNNQLMNGFTKKKQLNEPQNSQFKLNQTNHKEISQYYQPERKYYQKNYKQNIDNLGLDGRSRAFEKKQSYIQKNSRNQRLDKLGIDKSQVDSLTPTRRKTYKYYFDE